MTAGAWTVVMAYLRCPHAARCTASSPTWSHAHPDRCSARCSAGFCSASALKRPTLSTQRHASVRQLTLVSARPQRILMISSEVESLARTGGLGDVVDALSLALAELGAHVLVVTPLYGVTRIPRTTVRWPGRVDVRFGWGPHDVRHAGVVELEIARFPSGGSRRVCLSTIRRSSRANGIYGDASGAFGDNELRFAVMSRGALEIAARAWDGRPDVIHAHDWHAVVRGALCATRDGRALGEEARSSSPFTTSRSRGCSTRARSIACTCLARPIAPEILWHHGNVNLMKGATALADRITTVSPTYAREILTPENGFGLDEHLRAHQERARRDPQRHRCALRPAHRQRARGVATTRPPPGVGRCGVQARARRRGRARRRTTARSSDA